MSMRQRHSTAVASATAPVRISSSHATIKPSHPWLFPVALFAVRLLAALVTPIPDCDETFNYWEPTHFITYRTTGLQTWEYSPEFALRSYLYVWLHAGIGLLLQLAGVQALWGKIGVFYGIRIILGWVSAFCELRFLSAVETRLGRSVTRWAQLFFLFSPGLFHATVAFLPQSFTLCCLLLAWAAWLRLNDAVCIAWIAVAGLIGWPFAALPALPLALDMALRACADLRPWLRLSKLAGWAMVAAAGCIVPSLLIDYHHYHKWVFAVLNIALYNSKTESGDGSSLYGEEPWTYYVKNLALNFNVVFLLATAAPIIVITTSVIAGVPESDDDVAATSARAGGRNGGKAKPGAESDSETHAKKRSASAYRQGLAVLTTLSGSRPVVFIWVCVLPLAAWLAPMFAMPHKEERFLFIVYPLIALAAAVACDRLLALCRHVCPFLPTLATLTRVFIITIFVTLSVSRTAGFVVGYRAPLLVYARLSETLTNRPDIVVTTFAPSLRPEAQTSVCVGKEWYRFPNHYFLPEPYELRFLDSDFGGLLPGAFARTPDSTWRIPDGMNDRNQREESRFVSGARDCAFIVDWELKDRSHEPIYDSYSEEYEGVRYSWSVLHQEPFLDAASTPAISRAFWLPELVAQGLAQAVARVSPSLAQQLGPRVWKPYQVLARRAVRVTPEA